MPITIPEERYSKYFPKQGVKRFSFNWSLVPFFCKRKFCAPHLATSMKRLLARTVFLIGIKVIRADTPKEMPRTYLMWARLGKRA